MEKPLEKPNSRSNVAQKTITSDKVIAQEAKDKELIRDIFMLALRQDQRHWMPFLEHDIQQNERQSAEEKLRIFAELLLPTINQLGDILVVRSFIAVFAKAFGPKTFIKSDDIIHKLLLALEAKELECKKKHINEIRSFIKRKLANPDLHRGPELSEEDRQCPICCETFNNEDRIRVQFDCPAVTGSSMAHALCQECALKQALLKPICPFCRALLCTNNAIRFINNKLITEEYAASDLSTHALEQLCMLLAIIPASNKPFQASTAIVSEENAIDALGKAMLHLAALEGKSEIVKLLLAAKADVNIKGASRGDTPLHLGAWKGHSEVVKLLIEAGADVNAKNNRDWTALHAAANERHAEAARLLIEAEANVNVKNDDGCTALQIAACKGCAEVIMLLIAADADVNVKTDDGCTALQIAAFEGHAEVVKLLTETEADMNAKNNDGWTALQVAAYKGNAEIVKLLIEAEADLNAKNNDGHTALTIATLVGHVEVITLLTQAEADVNAKANESWRALQTAAIKGRTEVVRRLLASLCCIREKKSDRIARENAEQVAKERAEADRSCAESELESQKEELSDDFSSDDEDTPDENTIINLEQTLESKKQQFCRMHFQISELNLIIEILEKEIHECPEPNKELEGRLTAAAEERGKLKAMAAIMAATIDFTEKKLTR